jgi:hypothetical protein
MTDYHEVHAILYQAVLALSQFQAGSIPLRELVNGQRGRSFRDFQIFLKVLELYGAGYEDDIDKIKYSRR